MRARLLLAAGALLILAGAAAVGFFVNALWVSGTDTGAAQDRLAADFEASQTAAVSSTLAIEDDPVIHGVSAVPEDDGAGPDARPTTTVPNLIVEPAPSRGAAVGRILIPAAGVDWVIVEGVTLDDLAYGPGHMPGTPLPGQPGNAVISGHRTTHGAPFFHLDSLHPGNRITVETVIGAHVYEVVEVRVVAPDDVWVTRRADGAWLTLTTCHPIYRSIERLIVFARLIDGPNAAAIAATLTGDETPPRPPEG